MKKEKKEIKKKEKNEKNKLRLAASQIRRAHGTCFTICEACLAYRAGKSAWKKKALIAINAIQSFYLYARLFRARAFCPFCPDGYYISIIPQDLFCFESEYALFFLISLLAGFLPSP